VDALEAGARAARSSCGHSLMMKGDTHMNTMITRRNLLRFAGLFGVGSALPASALTAAQKKAAVPSAAAEAKGRTHATSTTPRSVPLV